MTTIAYMLTDEDYDTGAFDIKAVYCPPCAEFVASVQTFDSATAAEIMEPLTAADLAEEMDGDVLCCTRCRRVLTGEAA